MDIIEKLNNLMGRENDPNITKEEIKEKLNEAASLEISKNETNIKVKVRGNAFNTLLLLAKLEEAVLRQTGCSQKEFKTFKMMSELLDDND